MPLQNKKGPTHQKKAKNAKCFLHIIFKWDFESFFKYSNYIFYYVSKQKKPKSVPKSFRFCLVVLRVIRKLCFLFCFVVLVIRFLLISESRLFSTLCLKFYFQHRRKTHSLLCNKLCLSYSYIFLTFWDIITSDLLEQFALKFSRPIEHQKNF